MTAALAALTGLPAQSDRPGATHIFITYRCKPADRPAFLRQLQAEEVPRLEQWQRDGVMQDHLLVFNQFVDEHTWDATLLLTFSQYAQTARWRAIERDHPGGLGERALTLATPTTTYLADREIAGGKPGNRESSIFVFIPYTHRDKAEYRSFIETYGVPQFDAWIQEKAIANYAIYFNHHPTGRPWDVMLVFEYTDIEGLARRDQVKWATRRDLAKSPAWKLASDVKRELREEHEVVMAQPVLPRK